MIRSLLPWLAPLLALSIAPPLLAADVVPLERAAARRLVDADHNRQPTIIALWSADCRHCKKNLQLFGRLAKSNPRLRVVTIAAEPASVELKPILDRYALPGPHYAYGSDNPEAIAYALDPSWAGELPRTFLFDGNGRQEKKSGVISRQTAEQATALRF